jgi:hypothetical protein
VAVEPDGTIWVQLVQLWLDVGSQQFGPIDDDGASSTFVINVLP